jgi:hypothetical protein
VEEDASSAPTCGKMLKQEPPPGYVLFSAATERLASGMWGGFKQPAIIAILRKNHWTRIRFGPQHQMAVRRLCQAVRSEELTLYASARIEGSPQPLPINLVRKLIGSRGGLPDRVVRPWYGWVEQGLVCAEVFRLLQQGELLLLTADFEGWYRRERRNGAWPSQRARKQKRRRRGRPSQRTEAMRERILGLVRSGEWSARDGFPALRQRLEERDGAAPSEDTLRRAVEELFLDTGEPELVIRRRLKRK